MTDLIRRGLLTLMLVCALGFSPGATPVVAQSGENSRYAAIVVDAASGEVLFARHADARRYPASITKVMTLYMAFEALAAGKIKLDDVITVSPHAASQAPSKLGLAAGERITLDDAMHATAIRSANDMAVAIAEHIAGSEERFASRMTAKAQELGMTQTRYVNANGLPDSRQLTSARDLAILARAIMRDYPQYYRYFGFHDWTYNGREYRNTNGLLRSGEGYDGMKTGYTNASGYNLAASAVRGGKRLVVIVLGGRSTASRNAHVAALMDTGFEVERLRDRGQLVQVAQTYFESKGFGLDAAPAEPVQYASASDDEDGEAAVRAYVPIGESRSAVSYASATAAPPEPRRPASEPVVMASATPAAPASALVPIGGGDLTASLNGAPNTPRRATPPPTTSRATTPSRPAAAPARPAGRWAVQVGAFREEKVATDWLAEVNRRFRAQFTQATRDVQNASGWYRSRFIGMTEDGARAACSALAERRVTCMVVRPE